MRLAREHHVPVLLNGQGGDELFTGYWSAYYLFLSANIGDAPRQVAEHVLGSLLPSGNPALVTQFLPHLRQYRNRKQRNNRAVLLTTWQSHGFTLKENWATAPQRLNLNNTAYMRYVIYTSRDSSNGMTGIQWRLASKDDTRSSIIG